MLANLHERGLRFVTADTLADDLPFERAFFGNRQVLVVPTQPCLALPIDHKNKFYHICDVICSLVARGARCVRHQSRPSGMESIQYARRRKLLRVVATTTDPAAEEASLDDMDPAALAQLLGATSFKSLDTAVDDESTGDGRWAALSDSSCSSRASSCDGFLSLPVDLDIANEATAAQRKVDKESKEPRCWWHFERHFDYLVDRNLRPVMDYALGRSPILANKDVRNKTTGTPYMPHSHPATYTGCNGTALQVSLANLVRGYKLIWKELFGGYECIDNERLSTLQCGVDRDFQQLMDYATTAESPWVGALVEEVAAAAAPFAPTTTNVDGETQMPATDVQTINESLFSDSPASACRSAASPSDPAEPTLPVTGSNAKKPVQPAPRDQRPTNSAGKNVLHCPGYRRKESEMVALLRKRGFDPFFVFLDQLLGGLEGCRLGARYAYATDLLTSILRLMPELTFLLIGPRTAGGEGVRKRCYFKRLITLVGCFLKYVWTERQFSLPDIYRDASCGGVTPFYLLTGEKELEDRHAKSAMTATLLHRLFTLTRLIGENCMEWVLLSHEGSMPARAIGQRLKRFVYLPLLSIKQVHELVIPMIGQFTCVHTSLVDFDYMQWVRWYLFPPPPLYKLRAELVAILRLIIATTRLSLRGCCRRLNEELCANTIATPAQDCDEELRRQIFLLLTGLSFFLAPEFLSTCVRNPEFFLGSYFILLPHAQCGLQRMSIDGFAEREVYPLQEAVLGLLKSTVDGDMLSRDDLLGLNDFSPVHSTILRRILALAWHYASAPFIRDDEHGIPLRPVVAPVGNAKRGNNPCSGWCRTMTAYSVPCSVDFLGHMALTPVRFRLRRVSMRPVKCIFTTADEMEAKVRAGEEFINHSRVAENDYVYIKGGVSRHNPIEMICESEDTAKNSGKDADVPKGAGTDAVELPRSATTPAKRCTLGCMLRLHAPSATTQRVDDLRRSVMLQCTGTLTRYMNKHSDPKVPYATTAEAAFGPLSPIWRALAELLCSTKLKGQMPVSRGPGVCNKREVFLGHAVDRDLL
ncbi:hypothetical protein, conserved [Babesia ovata]|uniref:Uncharacterized protein n=1 Tax=Babesia ovata TaxID=189622 RepID=A0A2H6KB78_9APIC|nr:uncharacterized protein BOVATA_017430 [Babesia ovata]GBE60250.1 hypothetical protein, conserved [Babesia ovata]